MRFVKITHPEAGTATVPVSSVPHHISAGWSLADDTITDAGDGTTEEEGE